MVGTRNGVQGQQGPPCHFHGKIKEIESDDMQFVCNFLAGGCSITSPPRLHHFFLFLFSLFGVFLASLAWIFLSFLDWSVPLVHLLTIPPFNHPSISPIREEKKKIFCVLASLSLLFRVFISCGQGEKERDQERRRFGVTWLASFHFCHLFSRPNLVHQSSSIR